MSCFVGLQQKKLRKESFTSCFVFGFVSGGVEGSRYFVGNSHEKALDLWELLSGTSTSRPDQYRRCGPLVQGDLVYQAHLLIPMVRCRGQDCRCLLRRGALADNIYRCCRCFL